MWQPLNPVASLTVLPSGFLRQTGYRQDLSAGDGSVGRIFCGEGAGMTDFKLDYANGQLPLPAREASEGPAGLEIGKLLKETGHVTLDVGFVNPASCTSEITFIDGDAGILRYR